ncbi:MAG: HlyD family efflux transporter periplasmic adaptor subunit [Paludibacter sp.]|nr:HlyD family efflux transporter periplasmic adaptor subunit [Paludibacter sp.]
MRAKISNKRLNILIVSITIPFLFASCNKSDKDFDASGTFETTEVMVSAEAIGKILHFDVEEGMQLTENQVVGYIDSTQLYLRKLQLKAGQKALQSRRPDVRKQIAALEQQISTARSERKRVENLVGANAATTKQLDDVNAQIAILEKQLSAAKSTLETTVESISGENNALDIQSEQIDDQLKKCKITSPITGTVLVKFAEKGELATAGRVLFKIADTNQMILRAYFTADQITQLKTAQKVNVFADFGENETKQYTGTINWISSKSEFTPKTIQTRNERANQVYAVKIAVKNDGFLKIGQYGNVQIIKN